MNKILIAGHPASGLERVEELLCRCGMKRPNPSRRDGLAAQEITGAICKAMGAPNVGDLLSPKDFCQIKPGSIWDSLILDLMLGNLEHELWGWADCHALLLMEYYAEIDQQLTFVLVYDDPRSVVTRPAHATDGIIAGDEYEKRLDHWVAYNSELLHFFLRYRNRCVLVHVNAVQHAAERYLTVLQARLGAPLQTPDIEVESEDSQQAAHNILAERNLGLVGLEDTLNAVFSLSGLPDNEAAGSFLAGHAESYLADSFLVNHRTSKQIFEELQASSSLPFDFNEGPKASAEDAWKAFLKQRWFIGQLLAKMHGDNTSLTEKNQEILEHRDRLRTELAALDSAQKAQTTLVGSLEESLRQRTTTITQLEEDLKASTAAIENSERSLQAKSATIAELESALKTNSSLAENLEETLRQRTAAAVQIEENLKERAAAVAKLEEILQAKSATITELESALKANSSLAENLEETVRQRTEAAVQIEEDLKERAAAVAKLEEILQTKSTTIAELESALKANSSLAENLEETLRQRTAAAVQIEENLKERSAAVAKLEEILQGKSDALGELQTILGISENRIQFLEASLHASEGQNSKLLGEMLIATQQTEDLQRDMESLRLENQQIKYLITETQKNNDSLTRQLFQTHVELESLVLEERRLQSNLLGETAKSGNLEHDLKTRLREIELLQSNLQTVEAKNSQLLVQLKGALEACENEAREKERMRIENHNVRDLAANERSYHESLLRQLQRTQEEVERLYLENRWLRQPPAQPPAPTGAAERVKTHLSYRVGSIMVQRSKTLTGFLGLPFSIISEIKKFNREKSKAGQIKLPPIHEYADAHLAEKVKNQLSYRLGHVAVGNAKSPLGWVRMPFSIVHQITSFHKSHKPDS